MGNITKQLELKKDLQCKSFDWFIKNVAYDMVEKVTHIRQVKVEITNW